MPKTEELDPDVVLDANQQLYQDLVETSQDLFWQCDTQGRYQFLNSAWEEVLGYPVAQMLGRRFSEFQPPEFAERDTKVFRRLLEGDIVEGLETVHRAKDGREVRLVFNAKAVTAPGGTVIGTRGTAYDITRRWKAEMALRESEERFRSLFEHASDGIALADATSGMFVFCNRTFCRMFGYQADEMVRLGVRDIHPQTDLPLALQHFARMAGGDHYLAPDIPVLRKDGSVLYCDIGGTAIFFEGRSCLMGSFRDVTERNRARGALEASEAKFRNIVNASPMGMHLYQLMDDGRLVFVEGNPAADRILGVDHTQFIGKTIEQAFPPLAETEVPARYREAARLGRVWWTDQIDYDEGGIRGAFEVVAFQTEPGKMAALFSEITPRKRAEAALAAEKERLSVTLRSIGDGVIATDIAGRVVIMNAVAEKLTGFTQSEAQGRPLSSVFVIVNQISREPCQNPVDKALATGTIVELANHTVLLSRDGSERVIADSGAPIRDAGGGVIGVVLVFRDMTEKLELIETSQRNQRLESLGVLAGGIAHDFNNLLGGIFGYIDLARDACRDPSVADHLVAATDAMNRARDLTRQLLTFAKGGAPVLRVDTLFPFLQDTAAFALSGSNVACAFETEPGLWSCEFDRNQIAQVVDNLVINAQQAMPDGGTLRIAANNARIGQNEHPHLAAGPYVCISVADSGVGIPREILRRIFDPFFTTKETGSGLGLATSYSIVSRHRGCIDVESQPGKGSVFRVYLPASGQQARIQEERDGSRHRGSGRILVMDDDTRLRSVVCRMLARFGYEPVAAADGCQALEAFRSAIADGLSFQAVILDLTVPGEMGGSQTATAIRALDATVPLFVTTGYAEAPVIAEPQVFGFTDSIPKPFTLEDLGRVLEKHFHRSGTGGTTGAGGAGGARPGGNTPEHGGATGSGGESGWSSGSAV